MCVFTNQIFFDKKMLLKNHQPKKSLQAKKKLSKVGHQHTELLEHTPSNLHQPGYRAATGCVARKFSLGFLEFQPNCSNHSKDLGPLEMPGFNL